MTHPRAPKCQVGFADRQVSVYHKQSTAHLHSPLGAGQLDLDAPRHLGISCSDPGHRDAMKTFAGRGLLHAQTRDLPGSLLKPSLVFSSTG